MKHVIFLFGFLAMSALLFAQDPGKDMKKAARNIASYNLDPAANGDKLTEAKTLADAAIKSDELKNDCKAWLTYGQVYSEIMNADVRALVINPEHKIENKSAAMKAYKGYKKSFDNAEKKYEIKDALEGMKIIFSNVNYLASVYYKEGDFNSAYNNFTAALEIHKTLVDNGEQGVLENELAVQDQTYYAGLAAWSANMLDQAEMHFKSLHKSNYENPAIYEALYKVLTEKGEEAAATEILTKGREKYPDDTGLLYAEINEALQANQLDVLVDKLKFAMEKDPGNVSVPTTLGNVYDRLYQSALEEENMEAAEDHFQNAHKYYSEALRINPEHFDAIYSIGALEYNKAAFLSLEMNALADDYSPAGTKKYEAKKAEMLTQFDIALPHFIKAEELNTNDLNTLIALKEIYARKDQFELSNQYKERIEALNQEQE